MKDDYGLKLLDLDKSVWLTSGVIRKVYSECVLGTQEGKIIHSRGSTYYLNLRGMDDKQWFHVARVDPIDGCHHLLVQVSWSGASLLNAARYCTPLSIDEVLSGERGNYSIYSSDLNISIVSELYDILLHAQEFFWSEILKVPAMAFLAETFDNVVKDKTLQQSRIPIPRLLQRVPASVREMTTWTRTPMNNVPLIDRGVVLNISKGVKLNYCSYNFTVDTDERVQKFTTALQTAENARNGTHAYLTSMVVGAGSIDREDRVNELVGITPSNVPTSEDHITEMDERMSPDVLNSMGISAVDTEVWGLQHFINLRTVVTISDMNALTMARVLCPSPSTTYIVNDNKLLGNPQVNFLGSMGVRHTSLVISSNILIDDLLKSEIIDSDPDDLAELLGEKFSSNFVSSRLTSARKIPAMFAPDDILTEVGVDYMKNACFERVKAMVDVSPEVLKRSILEVCKHI